MVVVVVENFFYMEEVHKPPDCFMSMSNIWFGPPVPWCWTFSILPKKYCVWCHPSSGEKKTTWRNVWNHVLGYTAFPNLFHTYAYKHMYRQMMYHDKLSFSTRLESQFVTRLQDGEDEISLDDLQEKNDLDWHGIKLSIEENWSKNAGLYWSIMYKTGICKAPIQKGTSMNEGNKIWSGFVRDMRGWLSMFFDWRKQLMRQNSCCIFPYEAENGVCG